MPVGCGFFEIIITPVAAGWYKHPTDENVLINEAPGERTMSDGRAPAILSEVDAILLSFPPGVTAVQPAAGSITRTQSEEH